MATWPYGCFCNGSDRYQWEEIQATAGCHWLGLWWISAGGTIAGASWSSSHLCTNAVAPRESTRWGWVTVDAGAWLLEWHITRPLSNFLRLLSLSLPRFPDFWGAFQLPLLNLIKKTCGSIFLHHPLSTYTVTRRTFSWKDFARIFHSLLPSLALGKLLFFFLGILPLTLLKTGIKTLDSCWPHKIFK